MTGTTALALPAQTDQANLDRLKEIAAEADAAQEMPLEDDDMEPPL